MATKRSREPERTSDTTDEDEPVAHIAVEEFRKKCEELAELMEKSRHVKGGWGNVFVACESIIDRAAHDGEAMITLAVLNRCVGMAAIPGPGWDRKPRAVHRWMKEIIMTGNCSYAAHIIAKGP